MQLQWLWCLTYTLVKSPYQSKQYTTLTTVLKAIGAQRMRKIYQPFVVVVGVVDPRKYFI